jgi:peptidoglycan/xylan/chitin deacetylase (PgdA/CDA1 family)
MRFSSLLALAFAAVASAAPVGNTVPEYKTCNRPGVFALTFDDGPFAYSWDLAKYLHSRGVKATFFTNGYNWVTQDLRTATTNTTDGTKTYYEVFKYYQQLGHEIASHTYAHKTLTGLTEQEVRYQLDEQSNLIYNATGLR